jgi:hypothetical protein
VGVATTTTFVLGAVGSVVGSAAQPGQARLRDRASAGVDGQEVTAGPIDEEDIG